MPQQDQQHQPALKSAVIYQDEQFCEPLRAAIAVAGAEIVSELRFNELNIDQLSRLRVDVLIVNLEPVIVKRGDALTDIVERFDGRIVFNDAEATAAMADQDRPRWIRHLACKIAGESNTLPPRPQREPAPLSVAPVVQAQNFEVWFLIASIGGPEALRVFLTELDLKPPMALVLVQHIGPEFVQQMINQLDQVASIPVELAREGQTLEPGRVFVVPPDKQTWITAQRRFKFSDLPVGSSYTPSIDQVLGAAVDSLGAGASAIVFSGMANDGVDAANRLIEQNGEVWVQSPDSCVVSSIVDGIIKHGGHSFTGTPDELAVQLKQRIKQQE